MENRYQDRQNIRHRRGDYSRTGPERPEREIKRPEEGRRDWFDDDEGRDVRKNYSRYASEDFIEEGEDRWGTDEDWEKDSSDRDYYVGANEGLDQNLLQENGDYAFEDEIPVPSRPENPTGNEARPPVSPRRL